MASTRELFANLRAAEQAVTEARAEIIQEITERMGDMSAHAFARAAGINKGNFYSLLYYGKWNTAVAAAAMDLLSTPIRDSELAAVNGKRHQ